MSVIRNKKYMSQICDFSNMTFGGGMMPTDIDGFLEINDEHYIFFEVKYGNGKMSKGQRLALERLVDVVGSNRNCILIVGKHETKEGNDIAFHKCDVTEYRWNKEWLKPQESMTIKYLADAWIYQLSQGIIRRKDK